MLKKDNEFWIVYRLEFLLTFGIILFSVLLYLFGRRFFNKSNIILLVGLNGAGKTAIFTKLINSETQWKTYSSLIENRFEYLTKNGQRRIIVDYPGNESLRKNLFLKWIKKDHKFLKSIIFVIDSYDFVRRCKDVAEFLYDVLYESGKNTPVLVACNKQNINEASDWKKISDSLEREIQLINKSREAALLSTDGYSTKRLLTSSEINFSWKLLKKVPQFEECIAESEDKDEIVLKPLQDWIDYL